MGGGRNKVFRRLQGRPLLQYTLSAFQCAPQVRRIVVVTREEDRPPLDALIQEAGLSKAAGHYAPGGASRADSVLSGLAYLQQAGAPSWVLVQDAARPFVRHAMIQGSLEAARRTGASVVAIPVRDTVKEAGEEALLVRTLDRRRLWQIQTPQTFRFDLLWEAYQRIPPGDRSGWTDDAMVLEAQGVYAAIVPGDWTNLKITTPEDLLWAEMILERQPFSP